MPSNRNPAPVPKAGRYGGGAHKSASSTLSYSDVDPDALRGAVDAVTRCGDALVFARTSDGGAYSVRVLTDGQVVKFWPASLDELHEVLASIREDAIAAI